VYEHSSASFYEREIKKYEKMIHINEALASKLPGHCIPHKSKKRKPRAHRKLAIDSDPSHY
jgi:hypothetical protein